MDLRFHPAADRPGMLPYLIMLADQGERFKIILNGALRSEKNSIICFAQNDNSVILAIIREHLRP
jgi:hypothetical protein